MNNFSLMYIMYVEIISHCVAFILSSYSAHGYFLCAASMTGVINDEDDNNNDDDDD